MKVVTVEQMREIDRRSVEEYNIPSILQMEQAGRFVYETIEDTFEDIEERSILVVCGPGNNGGDGFVVARYFYETYRNVEVIICTDHNVYKGDALTNLNILKKLEVPIYDLQEKDEAEIEFMIEYADIVVDAIFGTGLKRNVKGRILSLINAINKLAAFIFSVDIPSGLNGNTGMPMPDAVCADVTLTMGLPKIGLYAGMAPEYTGEVIFDILSFPQKLLFDKEININVVTDYDLPELPPRKKDTHKGHYGRIFIIGTSPGLTGAGYMAAQSSVLSGSGLITLGCPLSLNSILEEKLTEAMTLPLQDTNGIIGLKAYKEIKEFAETQDVVSIGPGIGRTDETVELVCKVIAGIDKPMVIDADGIFALKGKLGLLKKRQAPTILTPHPGEFSNLLGISVEEVIKEKLKHAVNFTTEYNLYLVLKGHNSLVVDPDGEVYINTTGNPGMATGGMGDVLTGMITSFSFLFKSILDGIISAVYLHGLAGDILFKEDKIPFESIIPSMLMEKIPNAIRRTFYEDKQ